MTLLNSLLAFGALAFTIPLAIHLLHRSRFTTIDWGAWHLLDSVIRVNRRRMQFANWLLLLLRCAIPILLAFCLARPVLTGFRALPGDAPRTIVIAIDDSRSMNAAVSGQRSRIDEAKQGLSQFLDELSRRDEVILIRSSTVDSPPATMGAADAIDKIAKLQASSGPVDLAVLIDAAVGAAQQGSHAQSSVMVVSDFQSCNVGSSTIKSLDGVAQRLQKIQPEPSVSFWDLGSESEKLGNVSVDSIEADTPAVVAGRSTQFSARIRNASDLPTGEMRVGWTIDGVALQPRLISVGERSTATARLVHQIDDPGVCEVTVSVEHGDSMAADNRRSIAVDVMQEINVVLVDGKPSNRPLEGETDFLSIALSPFAFGGDDQPDSVRSEIIRPSELIKTLAKQRPEIVMLANVKSFDAAQQAALATFVLQGGSLVVFDGDRVSAAGLNQPWESDAGELSFPAKLGEVVGDPDANKSSVTKISELNPQYTPWKLLRSGDQQPLADVDIYAYRKLTVESNKAELNNAGSQNADAGSILLRAGDGSPLVVMARRGRGQVCQFAIPCDASWTTLPLRLSYLPMMQQLVLDLAGRRKTTTLDVGQPLSVPATELEPLLITGEPGQSPDDSKTRYFVQPPGGAEVPLTLSTESANGTAVVDGELQWLKTQVPGAYVFRAISPVVADGSRDKTDPQRTGTPSDEITTQTMRMVEVPEIESQLRFADSDRLSAVAAKIDAAVYTQLSDLKGDDRTRRFGREIWRWLLLALLIAMVGELFLQQHLVGRRSTAGGI